MEFYLKRLKIYLKHYLVPWKLQKKRGIVSFGPDLLFEKTHDDVIITLEKTEVPPVEQPPISPRKQVDRPVSPRSSESQHSHQTAKCDSCGKTVYPLERLAAGNLVFHKNCFKCLDCSKKLDAKKFCQDGNTILCQACYMLEINKPPHERRSASTNTKAPPSPR